MTFQWDTIQRHPDGRILLLYRHQRAFDEGILHPGQDVLDIGGWGVLAQAVIEAGSRCTVLDLFTEDQYYPDRVRALPHKVGDARERSCFADGSFDVVTCFEMLEHCGDAAAVMRNAYAWLRPGGWLVGTMPIPGRVHAADEPGIEFLSQEQILLCLKEIGFVAAQAEPTGSVAPGDEPASIYFKAHLLQGAALMDRRQRSMKDIGTKADGHDGILRAIQSDKFTLAEFVAHYTKLLSRGYRATRWHHPRFGVEEMLPSGEWMFSAVHPDSPKAPTKVDGGTVEVHSMTIFNGADGNDGAWLECSCGWHSDNIACSSIDDAAAVAEAHRIDAARTDSDSVGEKRRDFKRKLLALGLTPSPTNQEQLSRNDVRIFVGWDKASLAMGERCGDWSSFESILDVVSRLWSKAQSASKNG